MLAREELRELIQVLREGGVRRYRDGSIELELHTHAGERGSVGTHNPDVSGATPEPATDEPLTREAEMELLFRSAGGVHPRLRERPQPVKQDGHGD